MAKPLSVDYQLIFESLPKGSIAVFPDDPAFTIAAVSGTHSVLGPPAKNGVTGKPLLDGYPDTSDQYKKTGKSEIIESYRRVLKSGKPHTTEAQRFDLTDENGTLVTKYWQVQYFPIFDGAGKIILLCSVSEDITERVTAGNQLTQTQSQLNEALAVGLIGVWQWDVQSNIIISDKNLADMFGVPSESAATGMPVEAFTVAMHPDDRPRVEKEINRALKSATAFKSEYRTLRPDGSTRWVLVRGRIERDGKGQPTNFPGVVVDITDRKLVENNLSFLAQAGATLSESLDYKKTLQKIAKLVVPDLADWCTVDILDDNGVLQQVALAHKDPAKVKWGRELNAQQGPRDMDEPSGVAKVIRTGKPEYIPEIPDELLVASATSAKQLKLLRQLGLSSIIIVPLIVQKKPVGAITLISAEQKRLYTKSDLEMAEELAGRASVAMANAHLYESAQSELAERKRLEEELRLANEELEGRVVERTTQLSDTNQNLQRSNQELQDFAYVASHDLQEPLRKIQAFGNLLEEEYSAELGDGKDYLMRMRGAAARMSALIEDILAFSRVTTKARGFSTVNLNELMQDVIGDLETRIEDTGATVEVDKLPTIQADPMQMRQLWQNLIANALKFHKPDKKPVVKINATTEISQTTKKKYCRIAIEDNGVGFDEKYLDRIFAVFQRLHNRDAFEGTGIGLAVCRKIVERHGGSITATSKPGKGATFIVTLPMHHKKGETL